MKKSLILLILVICGMKTLSAQSVLPGYRGYWEQSKQINIIDLIEFYPNDLPYLRNEIYARYGRAFATQTYRDYFRARSWYQEKSNFSDSWLSQMDSVNAAFILSVEQSIRSIDEVTSQVLRNIEYTGNRAILTFTSRYELQWTDPAVDFGPYGINGDSMQAMSWFVMGDWILVYGENYGIDVAAYKLDHSTRRITASVSRNSVDRRSLEGLLRTQGRPIP